MSDNAFEQDCCNTLLFMMMMMIILMTTTARILMIPITLLMKKMKMTDNGVDIDVDDYKCS